MQRFIQLSLIPLIEEFEKSLLEGGDDYLRKGERLFSLAREKYERELQRFSLNKYEKKLFLLSIGEYGATLKDLSMQIANKILRPLFKKEEEFSDGCELMEFLKNFIDYPVVESFELRRATSKQDGCKEPFRYLYFKRHKSADQVVLTLHDDAWQTPMTIYGYRCFETKKDSIYTTEFSQMQIADVPFVLGELIVLTMYNRMISDESLKEVVELSIVDRINAGRREPLCRKFGDDGYRAYLATRLHQAIAQSSGLKATGNLISSLQSGIPLGYYDFVDPDENGEHRNVPDGKPYKQGISDIAAFFGVERENLICIKEEHMNDVEDMRDRNLRRLNETGRPEYFAVGKYAVNVYRALMPSVCAFKGYGKLHFMELTAHNINGKRREIEAPRFVRIELYEQPVLHDTLSAVITACWRYHADKLKSLTYYKGVNSAGKAAPYITKKNIPQKLITEAKESDFNDFFGYIEFDESCDIPKVRQVATEFTAFKTKYLRNLKLDTVQLRFRLLGNYKASGLFYHQVNCLCVDVRTPSSFIHELGHCIDYTLGEMPLSEQGSFYSCWSWYCYELDRYIASEDADKAIVERLLGKTKYNLDYYRVKTECFARCFEIYVTRTLGVDISLCKPELNSFAYPSSEMMMERINSYFGKLFEKLNADSDDESLAA